MAQKGVKNSTEKRGLPAPFRTTFGSLLGTFLGKNGPGAASERFFDEKRHCEQTLLFTMI